MLLLLCYRKAIGGLLTPKLRIGLRGIAGWVWWTSFQATDFVLEWKGVDVGLLHLLTSEYPVVCQNVFLKNVASRYLIGHARRRHSIRRKAADSNFMAAFSSKQSLPLCFIHAHATKTGPPLLFFGCFWTALTRQTRVTPTVNCVSAPL